MASLGGADAQRGRAPCAVDVHRHVLVAHAVGMVLPLHAWQGNALCAAGAGAGLCMGGGALLHRGGKLRGLGDTVHQPPVHRALATHTLHAGAEDVGQIVPHVALVRDTCQPTGAGQHAQQRHFGQRHGRRPVIDQDDFIARQCQLIATARAGAIHCRNELEARVFGGVFNAVARLVGELAEVDLPGMAGHTQHEDVGARAKDTVLATGDDDAADVGVLEADAVERVMQLNVHPQVVAVELEFVARTDPAVLRYVKGQPRNGTLDRQGPVAVLRGISAVVNAFGNVGEVCHEVSVEN